MGQRNLRVNALVRQEISQILHTRYRGETVRITITDASISPDLRSGRIYYSVLGEESEQRAAKQFFSRNATEIRHQLGKRIVLKYLPHLKYFRDDSIKRGVDLLNLMDQFEQVDEPSHDPEP